MKTKFLFFFGLLFMSSLLLGSESGIPDPKLPGGEAFRVNGTNLIFYPDLVLVQEPSKKDRPGSQAATKNSKSGTNLDTNLKDSTSKVFGTFRGFSVVKSNSTNLGGVKSKFSDSSLIIGAGAITISLAPSGFVLYNQSDKKFELTNGLIQVKIRKENEGLVPDSIFPVKVTGAYRNYRMLVPNNPEDFPKVIRELQDSGYFQHIRLVLMPSPPQLK